jgi:hypothetical protein
MTSLPRSKDSSLCEDLLGAAWSHLAPEVKRIHQATDEADTVGQFEIVHGSNVLARLLAKWTGMPPAGHAVPTRLRRRCVEGGEQWDRTFGDFRLQSTQYVVAPRVLGERFGRLEFRFRLEVRSSGICYCQCGTAVRVGRMSLSLPGWLSPRVAGEEMPTPASHQVRVRVTVHLPLVGALLEYTGQINTQEIPK